ncbi:MAG: hypothetical protein CVU18_04125 [Betaproteobacteria bacterium HGW-Betaproteobacteria-12]|nr:MAG: hypothetical protein CVU18_04125 [Betaproteobacteria bacterium HGW-Betaproteobacteria-12]
MAFFIRLELQSQLPVCASWSRTMPSPSPLAEPVPAGRRLRFAGWTLDTGNRTLHHPDGQATRLSRSAHALLTAFLEHPFETLSRERLSSALLRDYTADDRLIDVHVSQIRRRLGRRNDGGAYIRTLRSEGYVFIVPVDVE